MLHVFLWLLFVGCEPGKIGLGNNDDDTEETGGDDTAPAGDTDETDEPLVVDTGLAVERTAAVTIEGEQGSMLGVVLEGDIDEDGRDDLLIGAPGVDREDPTARIDGAVTGMAYIMSGPLRDNTTVANAAVRFSGLEAGDGIGSAMALGDFNQDGQSDVAIAGGTTSGFVCVSYGPFAASESLSMSNILMQGVLGDKFGSQLATGDVDQDGNTDLVVGVPGAEGGEVAIYRSLPTALGNVPFATITSEMSGAELGSALGTGDVDGDGIVDVVVGAQGDDGDVAGAGAVYLFQGPFDGTLDSSAAQTVLRGENADDRAGASLAVADMNQDGYVDLVIGAPQHDGATLNAGVVYVIHGPVDSTRSLHDSDATVYGAQAGSKTGASVSFANDMDGDGRMDVAVGAPLYDQESAQDVGRGYLVLGDVTGRMSVAEANYVVGNEAGSRFASVVVGDTELTGDSLPDLIFAAPWTSGASGERAGNVQIVSGF